MKVSVIIPTYGEPKYLEKAIESVLNQSETSLELIVVDDNNPDTDARCKTEKLLSKYINQDLRVKYIKHEKNKNGAVARNTGIAIAQGKYIAFLDSDDQYLPDRLAKCCSVMKRADSTVAGVYTGCEFRKSGNVYHTYTDVKNGNYLVETLASTFMFCTGSNIFIKKSVVDEIHGFDDAFLRHQDYEFLVRVFMRYSLDAIPEVLVVKNNENINLPKIQKVISIKEQYLAKYKELIESLPEKDQRYIYHGQYLQVAELALRSGEKDISSNYYKKASNYGGLSIKEILRRIAFFILRK